jgi:hypothetical protein
MMLMTRKREFSTHRRMSRLSSDAPCHVLAAAPAAALRAALQSALCACQFASWQSLLQKRGPLQAAQRLK